MNDSHRDSMAIGNAPDSNQSGTNSYDGEKAKKDEAQTRLFVVVMVSAVCFVLVAFCACLTWKAYEPVIKAKLAGPEKPVERYPAPVVSYPPGLEYLGEPIKRLYIPNFDFDVNEVTQVLTETSENLKKESELAEERSRETPLLDYYEIQKNGVVSPQPTFREGASGEMEVAPNASPIGTSVQVGGEPQATVGVHETAQKNAGGPVESVQPSTASGAASGAVSAAAHKTQGEVPTLGGSGDSGSNASVAAPNVTPNATPNAAPNASPDEIPNTMDGAWNTAEMDSEAELDRHISELLAQDKPLIEELDLLEAPVLEDDTKVLAENETEPTVEKQTAVLSPSEPQSASSNGNLQNVPEKPQTGVSTMTVAKPALPQAEASKADERTESASESVPSEVSQPAVSQPASEPTVKLPENEQGSTLELVEPSVAIGSQAASLDHSLPSNSASSSKKMAQQAASANASQKQTPEVKVPDMGYYSPEEGLRIIQQFNLRAKKQLAEFTRNVQDYSCVLYKWDRTNALSRERDVMLLQIREKPFSVYCYTKFPKKNQGREWIYWENHYDGNIIINTGPRNLSRTLLLEPDSDSIRNSSEHDMRDVGISGLLRQLITVSNDLNSLRDARVRYFSSASVGDRACEVLEVSFESPREGLDFHKIEIFVDLEWGIPIRLVMYDWPLGSNQELPVLESYTYVITGMNLGLKDEVFTYRNAAYGFKSYVSRLSAQERQFMVNIARNAGCDKFPQEKE